MTKSWCRTLHFENEEAVIRVNEADMEYLSESPEFKDYSLADVVGDEWAASLRKKWSLE
jgi:hypothetical protein